MTSTFTLEQLCRANRLSPWTPCEARLATRTFFYTNKWKQGFETLTPGFEKLTTRQYRLAGDDEKVVGTGGWVDLERFDLSARGRVAGLVETFVIGIPHEKLKRPYGFGAGAVFERMRTTRSAVVEMRTADTRTFGFFSKKNVFVATFLESVEKLHSVEGMHEYYGDETLRIMRSIVDEDKDPVSVVDDLVGV